MQFLYIIVKVFRKKRIMPSPILKSRHVICMLTFRLVGSYQTSLPHSSRMTFYDNCWNLWKLLNKNTSQIYRPFSRNSGHLFVDVVLPSYEPICKLCSLYLYKSYQPFSCFFFFFSYNSDVFLWLIFIWELPKQINLLTLYRFLFNWIAVDFWRKLTRPILPVICHDVCL